jgi:MFS family permease
VNLLRLPAATAEYPHLRRNFALFLLDYVAFGVAFSLISSSGTVVPSFTSQLTDNRAIIGLAGAVYMFAWLLPQLFLAQVVNRRARRHPFIMFAPFGRCALLAAAGLIALTGRDDPALTLIIFLVGYWSFAALDSPVTLAWGDLLGGTIPNNLRGLMFGVAQFIVAFGALAMREFTRWALGPTGPTFPNNYALLFGIAGVIFVIGGAGLALTRESAPDKALAPGPRAHEYVPYLGNVLRSDREFRKFVRMRLFFDLALMAVPFYVVFGVGTLGLRNEIVVSDSILLIELGSMIGAVLMAWLSRRSGSRAVIRVAGVFFLLEALLALVSAFGGGQFALYAVFVMLGARAAIATPSYFDWMITHAPRNARPIYIGLTNTISALSNLAPFVGGLVLQATVRPAVIGLDRLVPAAFDLPSVTVTAYPVVFFVAAAMAVLGILSALRLSEPRQAQQPSETAQIDLRTSAA